MSRRVDPGGPDSGDKPRRSDRQTTLPRGEGDFLRWPIAAGVMVMMDGERLALLIDRHAAALTLYARQWCRAPEDVVQDAFVKLAAQRPTPDRAVAWLYRVVRNAALSAGRGEKRRLRHETEAASRAATWFAPVDDTSLDGRAATEALSSLPLDLREPVVAHLWGGLSFAEIGELMELSASTAHRRYLEGLAALRERLRVPCPNSGRRPS